MDSITKRYSQILNHIAGASDYISSSEIAKSLQVSAKTIRKDIDSMQPKAEQAGIYIQKKPGLGYSMDRMSAKRWKDLGKALFETHSYSVREQRFHYILQRLLASEEYIKSIDLADELFVSQTTISTELKEIRGYLAEYELTIENVPNYGIRILGKEQYIRSCMLSEYCQERMRQVTPGLCKQFHALFAVSSKEQSVIDKTVQAFLMLKTDRPYYVFESHVKKIAIAIQLAINCQHRKNKIQFSDREIYETQLTRSYQAARDILVHLEETCGIHLPKNEHLYLGNLLLGYRTFLRFEDVSVKENYYRTANNSSSVLMSLLTRYGIAEFSYNKNLREKLALYLLALEARLRTHMTLDDGEILWEMNQHSVIAKEFAIYVGTYLETVYHCPLHQSEYERLALVFLADILSIKKQKKFGNEVVILSSKYPRDIAYAIAQRHLNSCEGLAERVVALENYQINAVINSRCDLLLTDMPEEMFDGFHGTILPYSFDLSEKDYRQILSWYTGKHENWQRLRQIFTPELFFTNCRAKTPSEVKDLIQKKLLETSLVDESIYYDLCNAPHPCFSISNNGIAFLKTRYTYSDWSFCGVFQFETPIEWYGRDLHMLFVLSTGTADPTDFLLFNGWMESILRDHQPLVSAFEPVDHAAFMNKLHDYILNH